MQAGTFEERNCTEWAKQRVQELLPGCAATAQQGGVAVRLTEVASCSGEAHQWVSHAGEGRGGVLGCSWLLGAPALARGLAHSRRGAVGRNGQEGPQRALWWLLPGWQAGLSFCQQSGPAWCSTPPWLTDQCSAGPPAHAQLVRGKKRGGFEFELQFKWRAELGGERWAEGTAK